MGPFSPQATLLVLLFFGEILPLSRLDACTDVVLPLDERMQTPATGADFMTVDTALFMLRGLVPQPDTTVTTEARSWTVDCEHIAPDLATALRGTLAFGGTLDPTALRSVFEARYLATIPARRQSTWILPTIAEFAAATDFAAWPSRIVEVSAVKRKTRRIFRSPDGFAPAMSVSQTLDTNSGDPLAPILETEVGVKREHGEDWDFYAYNRAGELSMYSTFPAGERPAPRICIGCHYDGDTRAIERFFP